VPTWLLIVLIVLAVLVVGGMVARQRQLARTEGRFAENLSKVNEDLATAHAEDRGWALDALEAAARAAWAQQRPGVEATEMVLAQVVDRPGTDEDKAVFRLIAQGRQQRLTLGRRDGAWVFERLD
jgi:hypothetical protein